LPCYTSPTAGIKIRKVVPSPRADSSSISPLWASTIFRIT